ncbi:response regulator [Marinobacterium lacunae]|uniref:Response regulator n=1 Tax=Marinobacterium lacunae TaxID=1232683 RepID=A0A081FZ07_9GAMM|nr:response regulator [Marinobacterium lacunae]KEA63762.1 response regulator [Marinobacterium lacunae]MBR9882441.1 response regulator [Oceanospirillales bacterium]
MKAFAADEIAQMCNVDEAVVSEWIQAGWLTPIKLPGRGNNRVLAEDLLNFLDREGMAVPEELDVKPERSVLVVDDEAAVARSIAKVLRTAGFRTEIASDGFQGGGMLMKHRPSLVTLDLRMSGLNGYDVLRFIRNTTDIAHTKVLVISALDHLSLQRALEEGADAVLSKPFDMEQLISTVESLM